MAAKNFAAKKIANEAAAAARLAKLQATQKQAAALRLQYGYIGDDNTVIKMAFDAEVKAKVDAFHKNEAVKEEYLNEAFTGPSANVLNRWLAGRPGTYERVKRFFDTKPNMQRVSLKKAA